jgi:hypothetical protein
MPHIPPNQTSFQFRIHNKGQDLKLFEDMFVGLRDLMLHERPSLEYSVALQPFESGLCGTIFNQNFSGSDLVKKLVD